MEHQVTKLEIAAVYRSLTYTCRNLDLRLEELGEISDQKVRDQEKRVLTKEADDLLQQCRIFRIKYKRVYSLSFIEKVAARVKAVIGDL